MLDARAPEMTVGGLLSIVGTGLGGGGEGPRVTAQVDLNGALSGSLGGGQVATAGKAVQLKLSAEIDELRIAIKDARASASAATKDASSRTSAVPKDATAQPAGAHAMLDGEAVRTAPTAPWTVRGKAALIDFDPMVWWPGPADSPWRRGRHRINAEGALDVLWPPTNVTKGAQGTPWAQARGTAQVTLADSLIAGVAVDGHADWRGVDHGHAQATLALSAAGNRVDVQGSYTPPAASAAAPGATNGGASDSWTVRIDAPTLATMQPLWQLVSGDGPTSVVGGALTSSATFTGRWPELSSRGDLHAERLRVGPVSVDDATARWQAGTGRDAPTDIDVALAQVHAAAEETADKAIDKTSAVAPTGSAEPIGIESATLAIQGTAGDHRISLRMDSRALPPAWTDALQPAGAAIKLASASATASGAPSVTTPVTAAAEPAPSPGLAARSRLQVEAQGALTDRSGARLAGWRGRVMSLVLKPRRDADRVWASASDVEVDTAWGDGPARVTVQPGRAELFGAAVNWQRLYWQAAVPASASPDAPRPQSGEIDARITFDPLPVAPLLQRVQPAFGWGGDLTIGGHVDLRSAGGFAADIVVERQRGDLSITDEIGTQALGLTDLRIALNAQTGVWTFSPYVNGKSVGLLAGAVVARTRPDLMWPPAETPIEGAISLDVSNLSAWGNWIPSGWRLGGQLKASALLSGAFGRPEFVGRLRGQALSVRNFLEGVNISDGDVAVSLDGKQATIEKFTAKGGTGSLSIDGGMTFGEAPAARLKLQANQFVLLGRVDRRMVMSGNATIDLSREAISVAGAFGIDEGLIDFTRSDAPRLSADVTVVRAAASAPTRTRQTPADNAADAQAARPSPSAHKLALDLKVDLGKDLRLRGRGLETGLRGQVRITSPDGGLAVDGTIRTVDGTYAAYGQKLEIDRGQVTFSGPLENPQLNIEATRPETDVRVGVQITGTALNPRIRLFSEPELSEIDKLSWLVLGRASDGLGSADTALLQSAAIALLSGEGEGITDQLVKAIGLDALSLKQTDGEVRETVISLGKQLSRRWYVGYERGLNATEGSWQLIYRIARSFTLRAQSGFENSIDVIWTWRWN
jgi:translocation and assembly module TamB